MDFWDIAYQSLLLVTFIFSLRLVNQKKFKIFPYLLGITNFVELFIFFIKHENPEYPILYHFYIPIEYCLLAYFYYRITDIGWGKRFAFYSIFGLPLICIFISFNINPFKFPTLQFNVAGVCLIILALISIFSIMPEESSSIWTHPVFIINIGILVFYSGNLLLMGVYNYLRDFNLELAKSLFRAINTSLNFVMYLMFITAFVCLSRTRKL